MTFFAPIIDSHEREIGVVVEDEAEVRARRPFRTDRDGGQQEQRQIARGAH